MQFRLQIIATGEFLVLGKDGTLAVQINTTLFNSQGDFFGSKSYPGTCPLEPNKAVIKNAHLILTDPALRTFRVRAYLGQWPWKEADFKFTIDYQVINYNLYIDASLIVRQLTSMSMPGLSDPFLSDQLHFDTVDEYRAYMLATVTDAPGTHPMVFLPYKNDGAYKTIDPGSYDDYPDIAFPVNNYFNAWAIDEEGNGSFIVDDDAPWSNTQTPFFVLPYILKRIAKFFGFTPVGKWLEEENANRIVVATMIPVDTPFIIADYYHFMPDMAVSDFLQEMRAKHGLLIDFNELDKICIIESLENLEKTADVVDLRIYQQKGRRETGTVADAYTITEPIDDKDMAYTDTEKASPPKLVLGTLATAIQVTDITLQSVGTKMIAEAAPAAAGSSNWRVPYIKQAIFGATPFDQLSSITYQDSRSFKLRELYFFGLKENADGFLYPYGSSDNLDLAGHQIGTYTLALNAGANAYLAVKKYIGFIKNSKPFEMVFNLTAQKLISITANKRILVYDENMATVSCLLDQLGADMGSREIIGAKLTLYPVIKPDNQAEIIPPEDAEPPAPPFDNGVVYVKLEQRNIIAFDQEHPSPAFGQKVDIYVRFYADAGMAVPKDVTDLPVRMKFTLTIDGDVDHIETSYTTTSCSSDLNPGTGNYETQLAHQAPLVTTTGGHLYSWAYSLSTSAKYHIIP